MKQTRRAKIVGLGGIGSYLVEPFCRFLSVQPNNQWEVTLIDGDIYEEKNRERQAFASALAENKAKAAMDKMKQKFLHIFFRCEPEYLTSKNIIKNVRDGDVVMLCVDNHKTRHLVSKRCKELNDVVLISGGNDFTDGNVIRYVRKGGVDQSKSPIDLFPAIANPKDENPGDQALVSREGCLEQVQSKPQLLPTNFAIASVMLSVFYLQEEGKADFEQVFVDIQTQRTRPSPDKKVDLKF